MKNKYIGTMVDGHHYTDMTLQPVELAEMLGATPEFCKAAKYLTRDKNDKLVNIDKAEHCIGLEDELGASLFKYPWYVLTGLKYKLFMGDKVHPFIAMYTKEEFIQKALTSMLKKDYDTAIKYVRLYKCQVKTLNCL
jgi:hypothetical protein